MPKRLSLKICLLLKKQIFARFFKSAVSFAFPKPKQDSSIKIPANNRKKLRFLQLLRKAVDKTEVTRKFRQTIAKSCVFCSFCARQWIKQKLPDAKAPVGMTGFGTQKALTYQKPQAKAPESRFGTQKALPYQKPQAKSGNSVPSSKARTGILSQNSAQAEFWSFCTRQWVKQEFPDAKAPLSLEFCLLY